MLAVPINDENVKFLPSPEELKFKFLIKGTAAKKIDKTVSPTGDADAEDADDNDDDVEQDENDSKEAKDKAKEIAQAKKNDVQPKIALEFSDLIYLRGAHVKSFKDSVLNGKPYQMSSFSESKMEEIIRRDPSGFLEYNVRQFSRIYPKGTRFDSSNYTPTPMWNVGASIVALNTQTSSNPMYVNIGRFRENGNTGYVLKPEWQTTIGAKRPSGKVVRFIYILFILYILI